MARISYHGQIILHSKQGGQVLLPMVPTIKALSNYIAGLLDRSLNISPEDIQEIVVMKGSRKPRIYGYYDWVDGKLKLDKSKPAFIHNILYGLES